MDLQKIGAFIAEKRREQNLTQLGLAEKLNITDRAVSKWERGKSLPDASIMLELCAILNITLNDLLCGEVVLMDKNDKIKEQNLLEAVKQKQLADKMLLRIEAVALIACLTVFLALAIIVSVVEMEEWLRTVIILIGLAPLVILAPFMLKIEQKAGYYKCEKCGNKYVPNYSNVFFAMHVNRTRFLKCPKCNKWSWNKKVIDKED